MLICTTHNVIVSSGPRYSYMEIIRDIPNKIFFLIPSLFLLTDWSLFTRYLSMKRLFNRSSLTLQLTRRGSADSEAQVYLCVCFELLKVSSSNTLLIFCVKTIKYGEIAIGLICDGSSQR